MLILFLVLLTAVVSSAGTIVVMYYLGSHMTPPLTRAKHAIDTIRADALQEIEELSKAYLNRVAEEVKGEKSQ
jgi:hypothetical protein